jgi:hypothetical protein
MTQQGDGFNDFGRTRAAELVKAGGTDPDLIACPSCEGRKGGDALVCGPGVSGMRRMPCGFCHGSGKVWSYNGTQYRMGRQLSGERQAKDFTVREAAKAYGVGFLVWNDLEHGRKAITDIDDARRWLKGQPERGLTPPA